MSTALRPELLGLPVTTNGIELARTADVLVDGDGQLVGFELACRDRTRRFLPAGGGTSMRGDPLPAPA